MPDRSVPCHFRVVESAVEVGRRRVGGVGKAPADSLAGSVHCHQTWLWEQPVRCGSRQQVTKAPDLMGRPHPTLPAQAHRTPASETARFGPGHRGDVGLSQPSSSGLAACAVGICQQTVPRLPIPSFRCQISRSGSQGLAPEPVRLRATLRSIRRKPAASAYT